MNIQYGNSRQLTHSAIKYLNNYQIVENQRTLYVNFILQIYKCVPLLHCDYYSCSLFDDEYICNTFVLKYNKIEGRPYEGDIISVTKINISILSDGEHRLYCCEETKLLEKSSKFLINPKILRTISSKIKKIVLEKKEKNIIKKDDDIMEVKKPHTQELKNNINLNNIKINTNIINNIENIENIENIDNIDNIDNIKTDKNKNINNINNANNNINNSLNNSLNNNNIINERDINKKENIIHNIKDINNKDNNLNNNKMNKNIINNNFNCNLNNNNIIKNNINNNFNNIKNINNNTNLNLNKINKSNFNINNNQKNKNNTNIIIKNNENINLSFPLITKSKMNSIKIELQKKEEEINSEEEKEIMNSINEFINCFEDGAQHFDDLKVPNINIIKEDKNKNNDKVKLKDKVQKEGKNEQKNIKEEKVENKNDKIQREKINKNKKIRKYNRYNKKNYGIKFIEEIKNILSYYIDIEFPYILQIRCRLKSLHHSEDNFYEGCSICHKKIKNNKICCENSKKILLYNFFINVRDATGVVSIFFFNEQGRIFMGIDAEDYKKYLDDDSEVGRIILNKFTDEFFNNEYIFTIEFLEPQYKNSDIRKKKYSVIKTEIINKNHEHQLMKKLKNILNK